MSKKHTKASIIWNLKQRFDNNSEIARITGMSETNVRALLEEYNKEQLLEQAAASLLDEDSEELLAYQEEQAAKAKEFVQFKDYVSELYKKFEGKR